MPAGLVGTFGDPTNSCARTRSDIRRAQVLGHAVGAGLAGQPSVAARLPQSDEELQLALIVAGPLGRHRDHLPGDQLVAAALRLGHRPGNELVGGHAGAGWNGHRGLPCGRLIADRAAGHEPVTMLDQDGDTIEAALVTPAGTLTAICRVRLVGDRLILYDLHVDGPGPGAGYGGTAPPEGGAAGADGASRCPRARDPWLHAHHRRRPRPPPAPARRPPALSCVCVAGVQASTRCASTGC